MKKKHNIHYLPLALLSLLLPADDSAATEVTLETTFIDYTKVNTPSSISADGRYVAFSSWSPDFVDLDFNWLPDVFVYDRQTDTYSRVSTVGPISVA